jgi:radical SAM superfamily enzyme YgiQ (UPF0313 family)
MKILLISPPEEFPKKLQWVPLGLSYLGGALKRRGYDVKLCDMCTYSWQDVKSEITKEDPDIVGISCLTLFRNQSIKVAQVAKECNPNIKILMGGPHATFFPEHIFQLAPVDVVVLGEGEITIIELVDALENNRDLSNIKGIAFQLNGRIVKTQPRQLIKDLDSIPFPLYDDFDLRKYKPPITDIPKQYRDLTTTLIITSRGCPFQCQFCSTSRFWGRFWRARSATNVVDELEWLYSKYDVRLLYFFDDIFTLNKRRAIEICKELLKRKLDIVWLTETRVDCVDREMLEWMKKAGCYQIIYGVESGSPKILKTINKGFTVDHIKRAFKLTHDAGISTIALLMVGNPGEDKTTIKETMKLMNEIKPHRTFDSIDYPGVYIGESALTWIFPNTPLYKLAESKGIISDNYWLTDKTVPYYTGDHTLKELMFLKLRLDFGTRSKMEFVRSLVRHINARTLFSMMSDKSKSTK